MKKKLFATSLILVFMFLGCQKRRFIPIESKLNTPKEEAMNPVTDTPKEESMNPVTDTPKEETVLPITQQLPQLGEAIELEMAEQSLIDNFGSMDSKQEVLLTGYDKEKHSIEIKTMEWLTPWDVSDQERIRELIDLGKIDQADGIWEDEYLIYTGESEKRTYSVADSVLVVKCNRKDSIFWNYGAIDDLLSQEEQVLVRLYIKDNEVCMVYEMYLP